MKSSAFCFAISILCLLCLKTSAQVPVINSLSPTTGPIGTSVTINGSAFNTTPANNTVYFGAVKATVTSASASSLNVTVPIGATYQPITVTTNNLTAYANSSFAVTFPSNPAGITLNSFADKTDIAAYDPTTIAASDLDGDGKIDLATANQNANNVSVFRNTASGGAISFAAKIDYATGASPIYVAIGDLDGDGKPDMVVANNSSGTISVFKNLSTPGSISFAAKVDYAARSGTSCIAIGDIDGDGKPDLAVANKNYPTSIFKNTSTAGAISFATAIDLFTGSFANIAMSDIDGDGKTDIIGNANYITLSVIRNTSSGGAISFASASNFTTGNYNATIVIGDFDGDGKQDLATPTIGNLIAVLRNTSSPGAVSFATKVDFTTGDSPHGLALGDLDGDGKPDMVSTNSGGATVSVLKNNSVSGTIAFAGKVDFAVGQYPNSVAIADLDGDGKPDLAAANHNYTSSTVSLIKNQTNGPNIASFTPANASPGTSTIITGSNFTGATSVTIGGISATGFTVNSDTQITAVVSSVAGGIVVVTTPNGTATLGGFYNGPSITSLSPVAGPVATTVTINGTNFNPVPSNNVVYVGAVKTSVSAASATALTIAIPTGTTYEPITVTNGNRTAYSNQSFTTTFPANATGITPNSFAARVDYSVNNGAGGSFIADLDGDGKPEMITFNNTYSAIFIFRNTGSPGVVSFASSIILTSPSVTTVALGDVDGDGKTDIITANYSAGVVSVFKNTSTSGSISFAAKLDVATMGSTSYVAMADIDGDGKPDIAAASYGSGIVSLLRNTSSGGSLSFAPKIDLVISSVNKIAFGDLDGDGKPEMVVANYYAATVSVLKNTSLAGVLSFASQVDYAVGTNPVGAIISDLNGDGKPDVAVANSASATVSVLKNNSTVGTPSLAPATNYPTGNGPSTISVADVDGDGKPDLNIANNSSYSVSVLKNTGAAGNISFAPKVDFVIGGNTSYISTGDLDGDGKPELAILSSDQGTLSVLRNQTAGTDIFSFTPSNASVGTTVVISGINLTGATAVSFGGVAASSFTVNSDAQITATVAAVTGGKVSVTTPKGTATLNGFYNGPVVTSFSPASGAIGTTVTINGSNFNATPANNTVYFGAVKAIVSAATATLLTVTVPAGATYQPIAVITGSLSAYSSKPFAVTFPANVSAFTASSFTPKIDYPSGTNPAHIAIGDLDGDGKAEMVTANYGTNTFSIYKNGSSVATIAFAAKQDFGTGYYVSNIAIGDINGDGKLDLAIVVNNSQAIGVFRNTSSGGTISFATEVSVYTGLGSSPRFVVLSDLDGDGKPDMAVANSSGPLAIFRNTGTISTISFGGKQEIPAAGGSPYSLAAGDFDGDGKPDIAVANYTFGNFVILLSVFKNNSVIGTIQFGDKKDFITGSDNKSVSVGDLDGDGKMDLVITNKNENNISLLRNNSSGGTISFAGKLDIATGPGPYSVSIGDMDGDEKPDLAVANSGASSVSVFKNQSTSGTLSFAAKQDYTTGNTPYSVAVADLDGDSKPDLAVANYGANTVSVLRNQVGAPFISSFTPANAAVATTLTINGSYFTGTTAVSIGGIAASSFTVVSDVQITATVAAIAGGDVSVTTPIGTATLAGFYNGPVITTFSPTSGPIGTTITITGNNFNPTPAANTVYFGAVKAVVSAASATSLTVTVPVGTTFNPVTVTTGNLTAYAAKPFMVTFPANASGFTASSFATKVDFATATGPYGLAASDFDGDGKADIAVTNSGINSFSVLRNTSTSGTVSFAAKVDFTTGTAPVSIATGDFDGDGKTDLAVTNFSANTVSVFKNLSTAGTISFAAKVDYPTGTGAAKVKIADINGDGKPDIIVVNSANGGSVVSVYKNTSVGGVISFAVKVDFLNEQYIRGLGIGDFDNDGKPDVAISYESDYKFSVLRNTSANGVISFAAKTDFTTSGTSYNLDVADLDGDGKDDIAITNYTLNLISFFRNTTAGSAISFAPKVDVVTGLYMQGLAIADLDGDGKPDLAVANYGSGINTLSVLKNGSTSGAISFSAKTDYATGASPISLSIADADGDGKPDLMAANTNSNTVSVLRNLLALPEPCVGGNISYTSNIAGTAYQWQVNSGSGFVNISNNANYVGTNTPTLQLNNLPSAWYGYGYRCVVDGVNSNVFTLAFKNYWTGAVSTAWEVAGNWSCNVVPDANTDVIINSGTVVINSAAVCRSLKPNAGATITVGTGYTLFIAH